MFHRVSVQRLLSLSFLLGSLSCGGELGSMDPTEPTPPLGSQPTTEVRVLVLEPGRKPVAGATVKMGGDEQTTDASGWATLAVHEAGRVSGVVTKTGYAPSSALLMVESNFSAYTQATLLKIQGTSKFLAERGLRYRVGRTEVEVPSDAFVDETGRKVYGWISVDVTPADPRLLEDVALPWPLQGRTKPLGPGLFAMDGVTDIYSLGMADWTFTAQGRPIKIAPGKKAILRFELDEEDADDEVVDSPTRRPPMWWFRFESGEWIQEGNCTIHRDKLGLKYCEATVSHFTPWNADWPLMTNDCTRVQVVHARTGMAIPNAQVSYEMPTNGWRGSDFSDPKGHSCGDLISGDSLRISARAVGFENSTQVVSPGTGMPGVKCNVDPDKCAQVKLSLCPKGEDCACPAATPNKCGAACVNVQNDFKNCGVCGNVCGANQDCKAGKCVCVNAMQTACGAMCINTANDSNNCGGCGKRCDASLDGGTCVAGSCSCTGASIIECNTGAAAGAAPKACVDKTTDAKNCGMCGNACGAGERCAGGVCSSMWAPVPLPMMTDRIVSISASGPGATFAVGGAGGFYQLDRGGAAPRFRKDTLFDDKGTPVSAQLLGIFVETGNEKSVVGTAGTWLWQDSMAAWINASLGAARQGNAIYGIRRSDVSLQREAYVALSDGSLRALYGNAVLDDSTCTAWKSSTTQLRSIWSHRNDATETTQVWAVGDTSRLTRMKWRKGGCIEWTESKAYDSMLMKELTLRGLWGISDRVLIAVGSSGTILRTTNGGDTWTEVRSDKAELNAVAGNDLGTELFAVGNGGLILRSTNGGINWQQESIIGLTQDLLAVSVGPGIAVGSLEVVVGGNGVAFVRSSP